MTMFIKKIRHETQGTHVHRVSPLFIVAINVIFLLHLHMFSNLFELEYCNSFRDRLVMCVLCAIDCISMTI